MNKIIRYFNQNRKRIILVVIIIVSIFGLLQILNQMAKEGKKQEIKKESDTNKLPTKSIITGEEVEEDIVNSNVEVIEDFIEKCNQGNYKGAYQLLTKDSKEILYTSEEDFIENYCNVIFKNKKIHKIESFRSSLDTYTYQVTFYDDILSTGKLKDSEVFIDYITVDTRKNTDEKLNVSSLILKSQIGKQVEKEGININVISKEAYKEYEIYNVEVKNNTGKTILLDTTHISNSTYGIGSDNASYRAFMNEIPSKLLQLGTNMNRTYRIKVNKIYNPSVKIKALRFTDIIVDYETYKNSQEKTKERVDIKIAF